MIGLIGWGRFWDAAGNRVTVPAPSTESGVPWLAQFLQQHAASIGASFDVLQWPPVSKAQGGAGAGCDGYGVFDRRDLGTKLQQGSIPTRYGTLDQVMAAVAALNAHGCQSFGDLVMHQMSGENGGPGVFTYLGADGLRNGRGATSPGWFRGATGQNDPIPPFSPADPVPVPADDFPFGRELVYHNCIPEMASIDDAVDYARWLTARTGFAGYRFDDTKGMYPGAVRAIMDAAGVPFYSEYFDGNPDNLDGWATAQPMSGRSAVEDFTLHWRLQAACNGFDARLFDAGGWGYGQRRPDLAVGFVDNPDTDTSRGLDGGISQQVVFNKGIAYALMLNLPLRLALVYGKDYFPASVWPGAYGLKPLLDNLCWFARMFAVGAWQRRWVDADVYAYTRDGNGGPLGWSGGALVAVNFNPLAPRTVTVETMWRPGTWIHDYSGHCPDATVGAGGWVTIHLPSNAYSRGESFGLWAPGGVNKPVAVTARTTTQTFTGAADLDVKPVRNGLQLLPQWIYCAAGEIDLRLTVNRAGVSDQATVQVEMVAQYTRGPLRSIGWATTGATGVANASGRLTEPAWVQIRLVGNLLPAEGAEFTLRATYLGAA